MKSSGLGILFLSVIHTFSAIADDGFSNEIVRSTQLTSSIYMLEGAGGNITAFIGRDGVLLVDDDFAPMANKILAKLQELKGGSPRYIVNTHFHYDHTGGNEVFGSSATIIAADKVRDRLMREQTLWKEQHPPLPSYALPSLTFESALKLHFNEEQIQIVHFPHGHTDGDTVVFFPKGKVVSMGDLYFSGMYPIFHPEHRGSLKGLVKNLGIVIRKITADTKVIPGHGPLSDKAELIRYRAMIVASIETVKVGIASGRSLQQIQKEGLPTEWASFSHGYLSTDRWISLLYRALKK